MRLKQVIFLALLTTASVLAQWQAVLFVNAGRTHRLTIGMEDSATVDFDLNLDKPSPPPPPIGFYCFFSLSDSDYDFIDGLWGDFRPISDSASWDLVLKNPDFPAVITLDSLVLNGSIFIDGKLIASPADTIIIPADRQQTEVKFIAKSQPHNDLDKDSD